MGTKKPWKVPEPILRQMELEETVMLLDFPGVRGWLREPQEGPSICQLCQRASVTALQWGTIRLAPREVRDPLYSLPVLVQSLIWC